MMRVHVAPHFGLLIILDRTKDLFLSSLLTALIWCLHHRDINFLSCLLKNSLRQFKINDKYYQLFTTIICIYYVLGLYTNSIDPNSLDLPYQYYVHSG